MSLTKYVLVDLDGAEQHNAYEYDDFDEAVTQADANGFAVAQRTYIFSSSEVVYTPDGSGQWPPPKDE